MKCFEMGDMMLLHFGTLIFWFSKQVN